MFTWIRNSLQEKNVRLLYSLVGLALPTNMKESMIKNGAQFFENLGRSRTNTFETKYMGSSLGLIQTGIRKKHEPVEPEVGKFTGEGLADVFDAETAEEYKMEIKRLKLEVEQHIMLAEIELVEKESLHRLAADQQKAIEELTTENTKQAIKMEEMNKAFEKVQRGREADLEEVKLIYFDKE
jgi:hypothetical protein